MVPFPSSLFQRDYGHHHVVSRASHNAVTSNARPDRDTQNGLGGICGFNALAITFVASCRTSSVIIIEGGPE